MALAIEQALAARHQTGRGCHVEVNMLDVMLTCMADLVPLAARGETIAPHPVRFLRTDEPGGFVAAPPGTDPGQVADGTRREAGKSGRCRPAAWRRRPCSTCPR